jgi:hypothetical protein
LKNKTKIITNKSPTQIEKIIYQGAYIIVKGELITGGEAINKLLKINNPQKIRATEYYKV